MATLKHALLALVLCLHPAWADTPPAAPAMLLAEGYVASVDASSPFESDSFLVSIDHK